MDPGVVASASVRLVLISDTHLRHPEVPPGDLLIHAGDLTPRGTLPEMKRAASWLRGLPHPHKVVIAGNHDFCLEEEPGLRELFEPDVRYLCDEGAELAGLRLWGSPWTPWFHDWAFNLPRGEALREVWERIPEGLDVLITHGPPAGVLDRTRDGLLVGCEDLLHAVRAKPPALHVFGHIHEAHGSLVEGPTTYVNAAIGWSRRGAPVVVDL